MDFPLFRASDMTTNRLKVKIQRIDRAAWDLYMHCSFNPLLPDEDQRAFAEEWYRVYDAIQAALTKFGKEGVEGEFFMDDDWVPVRSLGVEISDESMLTLGVVKSVHDVVLKFENDYSIDICSARGFLRTSAGEEYPLFNIFIEKTQILVYSEGEDLLRKLRVL